MTQAVSHARPVAQGPWAGWLAWQEPVDANFLKLIGVSYSRSDAAGRATVMLETRPDHGNRMGRLHGGMLAGFADHAYFAGLTAMGRPEQANAVTVDLTMQYCGAGRIGPALRADVELLRETGRLLFLRMTLSQEGELIAASSATARKAPGS